MSDALSMTTTASTDNLPIDSHDTAETSRNDLLSDKERHASAAPVRKFKDRNPKNGDRGTW
jgi:hypothetical protein